MEEENNQFVDKNSQPMTVKDWIITLLIMCVPFVNVVMMFVWAFGSDVNLSKKNYFKASLIFFAIFLVLWIFLAIIFTIFGIAMMGAMSSGMSGM